MKHTWFNRLDTRRGVIEQLPFADVDGHKFGVVHERGEGVAYSEHIALQIVNYWNSINRLSPSNTDAYVYWID